jgi:hypothetical protein
VQLRTVADDPLEIRRASDRNLANKIPSMEQLTHWSTSAVVFDVMVTAILDSARSATDFKIVTCSGSKYEPASKIIESWSCATMAARATEHGASREHCCVDSPPGLA